MSLRFKGHSDDIACVSGDVEDEFNAYDHVVRFIVGEPEAAPGRDAFGIVVELEYSGFGNPTGTWQCAVRRIDEDIACPWPVRVEAKGEGYSPEVIVECPPGTPFAVARRRSLAGDSETTWWDRGRFDGAQWRERESS